MHIGNAVSVQPRETFQILDEPDTCVLILDNTMRIVWANTCAGLLLGARREDLLGREAVWIFDTYLASSVQDEEVIRELIAAMRNAIEVPCLDLNVWNDHGEGQRLTYSCQKMRQEPFTDMWIIRMQSPTGSKAGDTLQPHGIHDSNRALHALHRISRVIDTDDVSTGDLLASVARIISSGLPNPEQVGVRIVCGDEVYSHRYRETPWMTTAKFRVGEWKDGHIVIAHLVDPLRRHETAPSFDETYLLQVAADMVGRAIGEIEGSVADENEAQYRLFIQSFKGVVYKATLSLEPIFIGGAIEAITGHTADKFLDGTVRWAEIVHPDDRSNLLEGDDDPHPHATPDFSTDRVYRILHSDGTVRWIRESIWNICDEYEGSIFIQGIIQDVTDRRMEKKRLISANKQLLVLNQIMGVSASSLSLDELLEASLAKTLGLLDFDTGLVYLLNSDRRLALIRSHHMVPEEYLSHSGAIRVHHWPWNFTFIAGQPRYVELCNRPGKIEEKLLDSLGVSSLACIPISAESVVVGALFVGNNNRQGFEDEERCLLEAIGKEIGSGVLRSMLHKRLEAAHRETNLYIDIMTHDIKNAENVTSLYCDLLIDALEGDAAEYASRLRESVKKSTGILQNVGTIRHIIKEPPDLKPMDLASVIEIEARRTPDVDISFEDITATVWADGLLPEIFRNLIDYSTKSGGFDSPCMTIRVEDYVGEEQTVVVTVEDTGPGIPDGTKEAIIHRFQQGGIPEYGEDLGLYIVGMLVKRYGGQIWLEDRIEERPDLGTSFRFTLCKVVRSED